MMEPRAMSSGTTTPDPHPYTCTHTRNRTRPPTRPQTHIHIIPFLKSPTDCTLPQSYANYTNSSDCDRYGGSLRDGTSCYVKCNNDSTPAFGGPQFFYRCVSPTHNGNLTVPTYSCLPSMLTGCKPPPPPETRPPFFAALEPMEIVFLRPNVDITSLSPLCYSFSLGHCPP